MPRLWRSAASKANVLLGSNLRLVSTTSIIRKRAKVCGSSSGCAGSSAKMYQAPLIDADHEALLEEAGRRSRLFSIGGVHEELPRLRAWKQGSKFSVSAESPSSAQISGYTASSDMPCGSYNVRRRCGLTP